MSWSLKRSVALLELFKHPNLQQQIYLQSCVVLVLVRVAKAAATEPTMMAVMVRTMTAYTSEQTKETQH